MFRLFGLLLVGLVLSGCAEMVVAELAMHAASGVSKAVSSSSSNQAGKKSTYVRNKSTYVRNISDSSLCIYASASTNSTEYAREAKRRGLSCGLGEPSHTQIAASISDQSNSLASVELKLPKTDEEIRTCILATDLIGVKGNRKLIWTSNLAGQSYVNDAKRLGLTCGVSMKLPSTVDDSTSLKKLFSNLQTPSSAELTAAQKEAERLRQELAALKAQQEQQQQSVSNDTQIPLITIASADTKGKQGVIRGRASDNVGVAEVTIDGNAVAVQRNGSFEYSTFVPPTGLTVTVQATDMAGLSSKQTVSLQRNANLASATITFDRLNPIGKSTKQNSNGLALIIGVSDYENTPAKAVFADADAMMFRDYASEKLGIPDSRIKTMVNDNADIRELLLSVKNWLSRSVKQNQSDVYIFFAGHGLASDDGSKMYLLPYDGAPELLDDTAILRDRLFSDVAAANPRSVTVFLDTCYSGTTRGTDMLIASRPIAIRALEQSIPDNFTVMTAAAGDQTAKPLEEAKHGMFSYFLMKGMEGEADANNDNEITAGELHSYVQINVIQQSSGSQTPELQGDADRVLVSFQ